MAELYRDDGLQIYESAHYSRGEHIREVNQILTWFSRKNKRILDLGCSGGLHALEFAKRNHAVTGLDIERTAIRLAKKRSRDQMLKAEFKVTDIENDDISSLGKFDLIYSIGNVMSHIKKDQISDVFRKIRKCLDARGVFLFDVLINGRPFKKEVHEDAFKIIWERKIDERTGRISMYGNFLDFGIRQHFDVWGYTVEEIYRLLNLTGFGHISSSEKLDFSSPADKTENPVCLKFRARIKEAI
jgi:SAM-dependent methyltransferase